MKAMKSAKASRARPQGASRQADPPSGAELARRWAAADVFSPGFAACMCAGGFHAPIDSRAVAEDLLVYLADKYRRAGDPALAEFVDSGRRRSGDFGAWLTDLDQADLAPGARALLLQDVRTTVETMTTARGFACT
jgi:hypothetical protein